MKKLYVQTYGCQMNVYDSSKMTDMLLADGYTKTDDMAESDLVILNTCHIREKAADKMYSDLGRIRELKYKRRAEGRRFMIAVAGCVAQAEGEEIIRRAPYVDMVVGSQATSQLLDMVKNAENSNGRPAKQVALDFSPQEKFDSLPVDALNPTVSAFLTIQEGCDKFCTFCVVPYTRGAEFSRPVSAIYREAISLLSKGVKEITLLGQNVNAYHGEGPDGKTWGIARLIRLLAELEGLERIRYTTSHPNDMDDDLILAHKEVPSLMPFPHLPVQSGSDAILKKMNRKHGREKYFETIESLREARPDIVFSSDFIVGYPGETQKDFEDTLDLVQRTKFAMSYSFAYSPRPGTPAADLEDQLPNTEKLARLHKLQDLLMKQHREYNEGFVGKTLPVLFEKQGDRAGQLVGRSPYMQNVYISGNCDIIGRIIPVKITTASASSLVGEITQ